MSSYRPIFTLAIPAQIMLFNLQQLYRISIFVFYLSDKASCAASIAKMRIYKFQYAAVLTVVQVFRATIAHSESRLCRFLSHDEGWPVLEEWQTLNASVSGRLIRTVPAAHVCHDPTYNESLCAAVRESWIYPWGQYVY